VGEKNSFNMILYPYIYSRVIVVFRTMKDKPITKKVVLFPYLYQNMLWYGLFMLVDGMTWNRHPPTSIIHIHHQWKYYYNPYDYIYNNELIHYYNVLVIY